MNKFSYRFTSKADEAAHIILSLYQNEIYEQQEEELIAFYGEETVEEAINIISPIIKYLKRSDCEQ